jgi:hypothetical protein
VTGAETWYLALRDERDESNVEGMEAKVSPEGTSYRCETEITWAVRINDTSNGVGTHIVLD